MVGESERLKRELEDLIAEGRFITSAPIIWDYEVSHFRDNKDEFEYLLEEDEETKEALKELSEDARKAIDEIRRDLNKAEYILDVDIPTAFDEAKPALSTASNLTYELETYYKTKFGKLY